MTGRNGLLSGLGANFAGQAISAVANFAFIPFYIRLLGIDAYGLIGMFAVVLAAATLLDAGMTPTLNREMASFRAGRRQAGEARNLLVSFLVIGLVALLVATAIGLFAAPLIATLWLAPGRLAPHVVANALTLMLAVATLRVIEGLLRGALLGLQRSVAMNVIGSIFVLLRAAGVLLPLSLSPTITTFFVWQAAVCATGIVALSVAAFHAIGPSAGPTRFDFAALLRLRGFAGSIFATSMLAMVLSQADKIILARQVSLETFGYYSVGIAIAAVLYQGVLPIAQSYFPHFTMQYEGGDASELAPAYHQATQLVAVLVGAAASFVFAFAEPLLLLWSGDPLLAGRAGLLLRILIVASSFHCLMYIPYMLQLAAGWSRLAVIVNGAVACVYLPLVWLTTRHYGAAGAAAALAINNLTLLLVTSVAMHRHLLRGQWVRWLLSDLVPPVAAAAVVAAVAWKILPLDHGSVIGRLSMLSLAGVVTLLASILASSEMRRLAVTRLRPARISPAHHGSSGA